MNIEKEFDIYDSNIKIEFPEYLESLRKEKVVFLQKSNCWLITGMEEAKKILLSEDASSEPLQNIDSVLLSSHGDVHARIRKKILSFFQNIKSPNEEEIDHMISHLMRNLTNRNSDFNEFDVIKNLINPLVFYTTFYSIGLLSLPRNLDIKANEADFNYCINFIDKIFSDWEFIYELVTDENNQTSEYHQLYEAIQEIKNIDVPEYHKFLKMFLVASMETTASLISSCIFYLHKNKPDISSFSHQFIDEILVLHAPVQYTFRKAINNIDINGKKILKGDTIAISISVANSEIACPVSAHKPVSENLKKHIAFGYGKHRCLGENLGKAITLSFLKHYTLTETHSIKNFEIDTDNLFTFRYKKLILKEILKSKEVKLADVNQDNFLKKHNYILLKEFLTKKHIAELLDYFKKCALNQDKTKPNYLYVAPEKSTEISATIKNIIQERFHHFFESGNLLGGVFMIKKPGEDKEVDFHQDWSLVDETFFSSYNLWCPLTDANEYDGALMLIDKSHQYGLPYRSASLPPLEIKYHAKYEPYLKKFNLQAGDAILYNHNMFHGSNNNKSGKERVAIACGIIPEGADFIYKHWNEKNKSIDSYKVDNDFYTHHIHDVLAGKIPSNYEVVFSKKFDTRPIITEEMFYSNLKKFNANFISKLYSLFQK